MLIGLGSNWFSGDSVVEAILDELRAIREKLEGIEAMVRALLEREIEEDEPLPDEIEAIESDDEPLELDELRKRIARE